MSGGQFQTVALPKRLTLLVDPTNRDGTTNKDARIVNAYVEITPERELFVYKRPGTFQQAVVSNNSPGLGLFTWNGVVYSIFNVGSSATLFANGTSVATGLDNTSSYSFSSTMGSSPKLVMQNGAQGYTFNGTALSATLHSINASYPANTVKGLAYLDGAMYVMQHIQGTSVTPAVIWGSNINSVDQPGDWTTLDFITAQIEPDPGVRLAKQLVYVIAIKQWSTEVFYDAGNLTGSPLAPIEEAKQPYGCATQDSVQSIDDSLFWISTNQTASRQVVMMQNLRMGVISTPAIERLLADADLTVVYSLQMKINGHSFYIVTIKNNNLTLVYDITTQMWSQWTDNNGNYFPFVASTYSPTGQHIMQHETNGALYYSDSIYYTDNNLPIPVHIYTPLFDAGTRRRKSLNMMSFILDQTPGSALYASYSDDDYQTWSNPRMIDMGQKLPMLIGLGTFTKRAFHFNHSSNSPLRLQAVELQYDIGTL